MSKPVPRKEIGLRIPMDLYEQVKNSADAEGICVTAFITRSLRRQIPTSVDERLTALEERIKELERDRKTPDNTDEVHDGIAKIRDAVKSFLELLGKSA